MGIFWETLIGAALTVAVAALICAVKARLRRAVAPSGGGVRQVTVLCASGEAEGLEEAVRRLTGAGGPIYIADAGMTAGALRRAEVLALRSGGRIIDGGKFV